MSGKEQDRVVGNRVERIDKDDAATIEIANDPGVVNDFMIDVNGSVSVFNDFVEDVDRAVYAGAETTRFG